MTVAVAVLCHRSTGGGFMAADRQLSMHNGIRTFVTKIRRVGQNTLVSFAGNYDQTSTVLRNVESKPGVSTAPVIQIATWISEERQGLANDLSEKRRVAIQGVMPLLSSNPEIGADSLPESRRLLEETSLKVLELSLNADFLIMGNDASGATFIAKVEGAAGLTTAGTFDQFDTIGLGRDYALMSLERWPRGIRNQHDAAYMAFEAKTMAQRNIYVGHETDMFGIDPTGEIVSLDSQRIKLFERIFSSPSRQLGANPLTQDEIRSIGDPFKPSAPQG